jgi:hypothetical protein
VLFHDSSFFLLGFGLSGVAMALGGKIARFFDFLHRHPEVRNDLTGQFLFQGVVGIGRRNQTKCKEEIMNRYICICAAMAIGLAICLLAPVAWRLVGAFCIGGGCYAIIEGLKLSRIEREIERYERPQGGAQPSPWRRLGVLLPLQEVRDLFRLTRSSQRPLGVAGWHSLLPRPRVKSRGYSLHLPHRPKGLSSRVA